MKYAHLTLPHRQNQYSHLWLFAIAVFFLFVASETHADNNFRSSVIFSFGFDNGYAGYRHSNHRARHSRRSFHGGYYGGGHGLFNRGYGHYSSYGYHHPQQVIIAPAQKIVYVERTPVHVVQKTTTRTIQNISATTFAAGFWYYCPSSQSYYPKASNCSVPWQKITPTSR